MSITTTSSVTAKLEWTQVDTNLDDTRFTNSGGVTLSTSFANGTGNAQNNAQWNTEKALTAGNSHEYDLSSLTKQVFGGSFQLSMMSGYVKAFAIECLSTGVNDAVSVTVSGSNGWTNLLGHSSASLVVEAGSAHVLSYAKAGVQVTATNKNFQVNDYGGTGSQYSIGIVAVTGI